MLRLGKTSGYDHAMPGPFTEPQHRAWVFVSGRPISSNLRYPLHLAFHEILIMPDQPIRWGILGTGRIAGEFAAALPFVKGAKLVAVGSRSQASADAFGGKFDIARRHATYESLAADPQVDAIYISTPHTLHCENTVHCLLQGKHVLCEKPFAINALQSELMIVAAKKSKRFLMEAMWTRFLPAIGKLRELLKKGVIGEPRLLQADFGFRAGFDPKGRLFDLNLGGGALLDVGVYTVSLASMIFGEPDQVTAEAHLGKTGVDEQTGMVLRYKGGRLAVLSTAVRTETPQEATLLGTEGWLRVQRPWWKATTITIHREKKKDQTIAAPIRGNGYNHQADEVVRCLRAGKKQSEVMPLSETLSIMRTLDALRASLGLRYPVEK
jgi:predicted dehydrogenase